MKNLRALAAKVVALQAKARALGLFANDRELLKCPGCRLMENVAAGGRLFTCHPEALDEDTGLRFEELAHGGFRCPACRAMAREEDSFVPIAKKTKKGKRSCRSERKPGADGWSKMFVKSQPKKNNRVIGRGFPQ